MNELSLLELTAVVKMAEKKLKELKDGGEIVSPGSHPFNFDLHCEGQLSRGVDTKVSPTFSMNSMLKAVLLHCAQKMPGQGAAWLNNLLSIDGALGAVVRLGPDAVIKRVDSHLLTIWETAESEAKTQFQASQPKTDRAGNTIVVGEMEKAAVKMIAAKKKPK
jgi:hypothetical protein